MRKLILGMLVLGSTVFGCEYKECLESAKASIELYHINTDNFLRKVENKTATPFDIQVFMSGEDTTQTIMMKHLRHIDQVHKKEYGEDWIQTLEQAEQEMKITGKIFKAILGK